jgi:hypothetical protein
MNTTILRSQQCFSIKINELNLLLVFCPNNPSTATEMRFMLHETAYESLFSRIVYSQCKLLTVPFHSTFSSSGPHNGHTKRIMCNYYLRSSPSQQIYLSLNHAYVVLVLTVCSYWKANLHVRFMLQKIQKPPLGTEYGEWNVVSFGPWYWNYTRKKLLT